MEKLNLITFFQVIFFLIIANGCTEKEVVKQDTSPSIEFIGDSDPKPVIDSEGGIVSIDFNAKSDWYANLESDWLSIEPSKGNAGTVSLKVIAISNETYYERNAALTITSGNTRKKLTITQKQKDALIVTSNKVEVSMAGGVFSVELKSNTDVSYEIDSEAKGWIKPVSSRGLTTTVWNFEAEENPSEEARSGIITVKGNNLTEEITVYQEGSKPAIIISKKECIVSDKGDTLKIELKSNIEYEVKFPDVDWIKEVSSRSFSAFTHYYIISVNDSYDSRSADIVFINKENNIEETVRITQVQKNAILMAQNKYTANPDGETIVLDVNTNVDFSIKVPQWIEASDKSRGLIEKKLSFTVKPNVSSNNRTGNIELFYGDLKQYVEVSQRSILAEKHRQALIELYKATDGDNWTNNTNWCSDKPIYEWYGVNHCYGDWERIKKDYVVSLSLENNNLRGVLPEGAAILMDSCHRADPWYKGFNISGNGIVGKIPESVFNHPKWEEIGWDIISQSPGLGDIIVPDKYNLFIENKGINVYNTGKDTELYNTLSDNEVTIVYNLSGGEICFETIDFTEERVNQHLDYHNKGLGTVYCFREKENIKKWVEKYVPDNVPEDILFTTDWGHRTGAHYPHGWVYMYDKKGELIYSALRVYDIPESWYNNKVDSVLRSRLGEPEDHPHFEMDDFYTSTDYSKDGEVFTLQKASEGSGLDLVLLGEAFVDKDMEPGGYYEETMKNAMEELFSIEPYKSLRNRFNVYSVKVVSPNNIFNMPEASTAIMENNGVCFEYANKIPNLKKDRLWICVVYGKENLWRSYTSMYDDGSFVSYMMKGVSEVLIHEVGGHGIAQLLDEYIEYGNEDASLPEDQKNLLDYYWQNMERGANVDWKGNLSEIKWSHLLNDERFDSEKLGIYEGAFLYRWGAYRSSENSMMRYNDYYFNAPSREQIYKTVMKYSEADSWTYDYETFVKFDMNSGASHFSRVMDKDLSDDEKEEFAKNHHSPVFVKGGWKDEIGRKKSITVPLR